MNENVPADTVAIAKEGVAFELRLRLSASDHDHIRADGLRVATLRHMEPCGLPSGLPLRLEPDLGR